MSDSKKNQPEKKKRVQDDGWEERVNRKGWGRGGGLFLVHWNRKKC